MSERVYRAIAEAETGFVESPAGCGKTEAIVRTVGGYCTGPQLVLTHTQAGVDALRGRFRRRGVPAKLYRVDTIAGWAWGWVAKYPQNAGYEAPSDIADWTRVYTAMAALLDKDFVRRGILNSYAGIIVDEYQDCTVQMHRLVVKLNSLLPCRVLGDELQGIFDFNSEPLVRWADVQADFGASLGTLETPHRWMRSGQQDLGQWLLDARGAFRARREPNYSGSPIVRRTIRVAELARELIRMTHAVKGSRCVIRPKTRNLGASLESALVKHGYQVLEPNDLRDLHKLILALAESATVVRSKATLQFVNRVYGGLPQDDKHFIKRLLQGVGREPRRTDRRILHARRSEGLTPRLVWELVKYCENLGNVSCKLRASVSALKCILEEHCESGSDIGSVHAREMMGRRSRGRGHVDRAIGSTLLVKGLEYDHAVILRGADWRRSWGGYYDLYVALTRGSRTVTIMEMSA